MMRPIQKMLLVLLLSIALWLWLPLLKWQRLFEASPEVRFAIPAFHALVKDESKSLPMLPKLTAVELTELSEAQFASLQRLNLPVFNRVGRWQIGPYLDRQEADAVAQQVYQNLKIPVTIVNY